MVVSDLVNVRYLSGFTGSNAALLVFGSDTGAALVTDSRYRTQALRQAPDLTTVIERACARHLVARAVTAGARRIGFESHIVTVDGFDALAGEVEGHADAELVRASGVVEELREVKDADEIAILRRACEAGLMMTGEPAASAASVDPAGIATGKFHGGVTTVSFDGVKLAPATEPSAFALSA